jgi:hypothetical protein
LLFIGRHTRRCYPGDDFALENSIKDQRGIVAMNAPANANPR